MAFARAALYFQSVLSQLLPFVHVSLMRQTSINYSVLAKLMVINLSYEMLARNKIK